MKVKLIHLVTATLLGSASLVVAGPGHENGQTRGNHGAAANGHGNSDFGHRQRDPNTRTKGSQNSAFGRSHHTPKASPTPTTSPVASPLPSPIA
jgi:hypothetical protein